MALPRARDSFRVIDELVEAASIGECSLTEDLALELWLRVRGVWLWAETVDGEPSMQSVVYRVPNSAARPESIPAELRDPLAVLHGSSSNYGPPVRIAEACARIAEWAAEHNLPHTAVAFSEAAAAASPSSPRAMHLAARLNRMMGDSSRAEVYYERALIIARRKKRWDLYVRANLGLGTLKADKGEISASLAHFHAAARAAASESGEKWLAAETAHDLFVLLADTGEFAAAETQAVKALSWYPKHHARFPLAVHDYAMVFVRQGQYGTALPLLESVLKSTIPPVDQVIVWSTYARVLGGFGRVDKFREAEQQLQQMMSVYPHHASAANVNLGFACASLGLWESAEAYAKEGIRRARTPTSPEALVGDDLLRMIEARGARPEASLDTSSAPELLREVLRRLAEWRGPTWRRKRQAGPGPIPF